MKFLLAQLLGACTTVVGICFALSVHQSSPAGYRLCSMCKSGSWVIYCFSTGAYTLMLTHLSMIVSIVIAMVREHIRTQKGA